MSRIAYVVQKIATVSHAFHGEGRSTKRAANHDAPLPEKNEIVICSSQKLPYIVANLQNLYSENVYSILLYSPSNV